MVDGIECIPNPALPLIIRGAIWNSIETRSDFASGECRKRSSLEQLANKFGASDLGLEIDINAKVVDGDGWLDKRVGGSDLDVASAEREESPEINTDWVGISIVVKELNNRSCMKMIRNV